MKTYVKVILIVVTVLFLGVGYVAYHIYQLVNGSEAIAGKRGEVPVPAQPADIPPLSAGESDWPNWRGVSFDGKSSARGIATNWAGGLKKIWQVDYLCQDQATASWSAPVVRGNRLVTPGRNAGSDLVFCINADTGKLIWMSSYEALAGTSHGPGARATPFIDGERVYTFGRSGDLACWQLLDGKLLWRKNVKDEGGVEPDWGYSGTPLVLGGKVIVQGGGKALVIAYDKGNGAVLWKSMEGTAGYSASIPVPGAGGSTNILVYHAKALSCLNSTDGKEIWRAPWETKYGVNATTPARENSIIFHTSAYKMGCEALLLKEGGFSLLWKNDVIAAQHTDPVIINGYVYCYSGDSSSNKGQFKCLELATGKEMWSTDQVGQGTTTFADGYLICFDIKGNLFLVRPDPSGFIKAGEVSKAMDEVGNSAWTVPVVANGKLYVRYMQKLVCYNLLP
ncbi:MAG: PQQ-binding-like beta-propeller repeat protein [bacterium]